jgi:3-methyladenine DNA glycosylase/8-oxoguanine DNA glycosylase
VRHAAERLGIEDVGRHSERWRPWRSYALHQLWATILIDRWSSPIDRWSSPVETKEN